MTLTPEEISKAISDTARTSASEWLAKIFYMSMYHDGFPPEETAENVKFQKIGKEALVYLMPSLEEIAKASLAKAHSGEGLSRGVGNVLQLVCWCLVAFSQGCDGTMCNKGEGSDRLCYGLQEYADQIIALFPAEEEIRKAIQQEVCANCDTPLEADFQKQQIVDARKLGE